VDQCQEIIFMNIRIIGLAEILCALCLLNSMPAVHAAQISLDFTSLPSAQGWGYESTGQVANESSVFSIANGALMQNTMGIGLGLPGSSVYRLYNQIDPTLPFTLSVRARVVEDESTDFSRPFGFSIAAFTGTEEVGIGLSSKSIQTVDGIMRGADPIAFDTTQFHTYQLLVRPGLGYELYVDSNLFTSGSAFPLVYPNSLLLGDGTGAANARAEITSLSFSQIPEPSATALFVAGFGLFCAMRHRRA